MDYEQLVQSLDQLIKSGAGDEALELLAQLRISEIPRSQRIFLAEAARRLNQNHLGLRILNPIVRPKVEMPSQVASGREKACYASLLIRIGALPEAKRWLEGVSSQETPEVDLYLAHFYVAQWDYRAAHFHLCKYGESTSLSSYQRALNQLNIASCLVSLARNSEAMEVLDSLRNTNQIDEWKLILGNSYELSAQIYLSEKDFVNTRTHLENGRVLLLKAGGRSPFFVKKWMGILDLIEGKSDAISQLQHLRVEANRLGHSEALREFDLYLASKYQNEELFFQTYFSTPFPNYRSHMKRIYGKDISIPESFRLKIAEQQKSVSEDLKSVQTSSCLDLTNLKVQHSKERGTQEFRIRVASLHHRLLVRLVGDLYKRHEVGAVFSSLFPDEYYNPEHSPVRVAKAVSRLREQFKSHRIPLRISSKGRSYSLYSVSNFFIEVPETALQFVSRSVYLSDERWATLQPLGAREFTCREASMALGLSMRATQEFLREALDSEHLQRIGSGRNIKYKMRPF